MNKKNKIIIFTSIILILLLLIGGTYAYYIWNTNEDEETIIATDVGTAKVIYNAGSKLTGTLQPVSDKSGGLKKEITVKVDKTITFNTTFNLYMDIKVLGEGLKHESFKFEVYKDNVLINSGNFSNEYLANNTSPCEEDNTISHIKIVDNETITTTLSTYTLYIWIDGNMDNPTSMTSQSFACKLHASGENGIIEGAPFPDINIIEEGTLAYKIVNDYNKSEKTIVKNNNIRYYYDIENSLMSDIGGNVRYYGSAPNNYVYFNCGDYNNQNNDTCEVWRIIGVFQDKVKIMRDKSIGSYSWDHKLNDGEQASDWSRASLKTLLNESYLNNQDVESYYSYSYTVNGDIEESANFKSNGIGIKDNTRDLIAEVTWNLGSLDSNQVYSDYVYKRERGTTVTNNYALSWAGKIALVYASDYGYAADFTAYGCNTQLRWYNGCSSNWMKKGGFYTMNAPYPAGNHRIYGVNGSGMVNPESGFAVDREVSIYPTLFLNADLGINNIGDGSSGNPYQLVVNNNE